MKTSALITLGFTSLLGTTCLAQSKILKVPTQYNTIQSAINASKSGDTVLVEPGLYYENINFRSKNIVLTSRYYQNRDTSFIRSTIIDGSRPASVDTGSCVIINGSQDSSCVLQGFTLTGGNGTRWLDVHGAGVYREGGAILTEFSAPTICFNNIHDNYVVKTAGSVSSGGGGIRCGDGNPRILNNTIYNNDAEYGGGIVMNYTSGKILNNVIVYNSGGQAYGGGGVWCNGSGAGLKVDISNNTIFGNIASGKGQGGRGGALSNSGLAVNVKNNILWANRQQAGGPIKPAGAMVIEYNDVQGGYTGSGNQNNEPLLADYKHFFLQDPGSPCIDKGDSTTRYNDREASPGNAKFPSLATTRNDMGAYGGPGAALLPPANVKNFNSTIQFNALSNGAIVNTPVDARSVNIVDVNNDGLEDVFISTGPKAGQNDLLYLNKGNSTFDAVSNDPIVQDFAPSDGATFGDVDNDGDLDAFVVTWHNKINYFYRNKGNGAFEHEANSAMGNTLTYSETASWGDYDNDGFLDLYVTNSAGTNKRNFLYHNKGAGIFEKVATGVPVADAATSRSTNWTDYDNDGDLDIFVTNEGPEVDNLYRNDGGGNFTKITNSAIVKDKYSSMSSSWGDIDNDGDLDLFVANDQLHNQLYRNDGTGNFTEITQGEIMSDASCSFGSAFSDVDNDGDLDLFVTNAFCNNQLINFLYLNDGSGNFKRDTVGLKAAKGWSYGCAFGDLNKDGFEDLVVANCTNASANNSVYINSANNGNHYFRVKATGTISNRSAIGAKVMLRATINGITQWQLREISAQTGQCGQNSLIAHFGLASSTKVDSVKILWPSGKVSRSGNINADQTLEVIEPNSLGIYKSSTEAPAIRCFPNPTTKSLTLQPQNIQEQIELVLTSIQGAELARFKIHANTEFDLKALGIKPGIYFLSWKTSIQKGVHKLILN